MSFKNQGCDGLDSGLTVITIPESAIDHVYHSKEMKPDQNLKMPKQFDRKLTNRKFRAREQGNKNKFCEKKVFLVYLNMKRPNKQLKSKIK